MTAEPERVARAAGSPALTLVPLALALFVYHPIRRNYFYADDFLNLFHIANKGPLEFVLTPSGGHILVARNAVFWLSSVVFGTAPSGYFWTVLLTHLVNVWLVDRLIRLQTGSARVACFGAALWGICPLAAGALTWYSVYGQVVATTGILAALWLFAETEARGEEASPARRALAYASALIAATSFGFGTGAAFLLPILIHLLFPRARGRRRLPPLASLLVVVPLLYAGLIRLYSALYGDEVQVTSFVENQIRTQGAAVGIAFARAMAFGASRLLFGLSIPPESEPFWIAYPIAGALVLGSAAAALRARDRGARSIAAWALLAFACYAIVAVSRTQYLVDSRPDFLTAMSRYHYLALVGLAMLAAEVARWAGRETRPRARVANALLAGWIILQVIGHVIRPFRLDDQYEARRGTEKSLTEISAQIAAHPPGTTVYIPNRNFPPLPMIAVPMTLFPGTAGAFVVFFPENTVDGRRVYFVHRNPKVIEAMRDGRRTRDLLVPAPS